MFIRFENKEPRRFVWADLKVGDVFRFKETSWGRTKDTLYLVVKDKVLNLSTLTYVCPIDDPIQMFESPCKDDEDYGDWKYFKERIWDDYEIEIFDADITLKKVLDR